MNNQEEAQKFIAQQLLGQQLQQLEQQIATIEMQMKDLNVLKESLNELSNLDDCKIHTPLGAGVFLESHLSKPETVLLNVGAGVIVKKDTPTAIKIIGKQIEELESIKKQMENSFNELSKNLESL